ncbi:MAG: DUF488 family protein [Dehalococcoidia bacterium]|nr:MAG: DUF488 family protein [Dehalococcoidia bacterium]
MPVRAKSIYEEATPDDGVRILTTNYWPRGVSKERAGTYIRALAPTRELLHAFKDGEIGWPEYEKRYLAEMEGDRQREEIARIAGLAQTETVTVMCMCKDERMCHRSLLRTLIEQEMERTA